MTDVPQNPMKVLVLGANGQLARNTTRILLEQSDVRLTLYLRRATRLQNPDPSRVKIVEGDVRKVRAARTIAYGPDAGSCGFQALVDFDVAAFGGFYTRQFQADALGIRRASAGCQNFVQTE